MAFGQEENGYWVIIIKQKADIMKQLPPVLDDEIIINQ